MSEKYKVSPLVCLNVDRAFNGDIYCCKAFIIDISPCMILEIEAESVLAKYPNDYIHKSKTKFWNEDIVNIFAQ